MFDETIPELWNDAWYNNFINPDSDFQKAWANLVTIIQPYLDDLKAAWDKFAGSIGLPSISDMLNAWTSVPGTKQVQGQVPMTEQDVMDYIQRYPGQPVPVTKPGPVTVSNWTAQFNEVLKVWLEDIKSNGGILSTLEEIGSYIFEQVKIYLTNVWDTHKDEINEIIPKMASWLGGIIENIATNPVFTTALDSLLTVIKEAIVNAISKAILGVPWYSNAPGLNTTPEMPEFNQGQLPEYNPNIPFDLSGFTGIGESGADAMHTGFRDQIIAIDWEDAKDKTIEQLNNVYEIHSPAGALLPVGEGIAEGVVEGMRSKLDATKWFNIWNKVVEKARSFFKLNTGLPADNPFYIIGVNIVQGLIDGINSKISDLEAKLQEMTDMIITTTEDGLGEGSPSKVFKYIGVNTMKGMAIGIDNSSILVRKAIERVVGGSIMQANMQSPMSAPPVYGNTVNFGDVHINNGMDLAVLKSQVMRWVTEG